MKNDHAILRAFAGIAFIITSVAPSDAKGNTEAFDTGYQEAAYFLCPYAYMYGSPKNMFKYDNTSDYKRGFAAFKAALKGPRPSKACFDAARASGWFTVR